MNPRPRIKIQPTILDKLLTTIGWCAIIATWVFILVNYGQLPRIIPTHYNAVGEVDGYGSKATIFILPVIATVIFAAITKLVSYPHAFNYPVKITEENALRHYTNAIRTINILKIIVVLILGSITFETIRVANGQSEPFGEWFMPISLTLIFLPIILFTVISLKKR